MYKRPNPTSLYLAKLSLSFIGLISASVGLGALCLAYLAANTVVTDLPKGHHLSYLKLEFWQPEILTLIVYGSICLLMGGGFLALTVTFRPAKHEIDHDQLLYDIAQMLPGIISGLLVEPRRELAAVTELKDLESRLKLLQPKLSDKVAEIIANIARLATNDLRPLVNEIAQAFTLLQAYQARQTHISEDLQLLQAEIESLADAVTRALYLKHTDDQGLEIIRARLATLQEKLVHLSGAGSNITRLPLPGE